VSTPAAAQDEVVLPGGAVTGCDEAIDVAERRRQTLVDRPRHVPRPRVAVFLAPAPSRGERLIEEFVTEEWEFDVAVLVFEVDALRECRWSVAASAPQESRQVVTHFAEQDGQFIGVDARVGFENRYLGIDVPACRAASTTSRNS